MAVGHWCWVASSSSEARRTSSAATEASTGTVVRRFIYANRPAVKSKSRSVNEPWATREQPDTSICDLK